MGNGRLATVDQIVTVSGTLDGGGAGFAAVELDKFALGDGRVIELYARHWLTGSNAAATNVDVYLVNVDTQPAAAPDYETCAVVELAWVPTRSDTVDDLLKKYTAGGSIAKVSKKWLCFKITGGAGATYKFSARVTAELNR